MTNADTLRLALMQLVEACDHVRPHLGDDAPFPDAEVDWAKFALDSVSKRHPDGRLKAMH